MSKAYARAGIDLDAYNRALGGIFGRVRTTYDANVIDLPDGFAGLYRLKTSFRDPVLVACTDGVGTKLMVAQAADRLETVGIDLVAMCVNDLIVTGATPLFFLDYYATRKLDRETFHRVVSGIVRGCREAGCALLGGETAEHPGMHPGEEIDLAGFAVGVVERSEILDGSSVRAGDDVIGLRSSGLHSNGYSLVRKILFEDHNLSVRSRFPGSRRTLGEILLTPTRIYVRTVRNLLARHPSRSVVRAFAHITGGGLVENVPRVLPAGVAADLYLDHWPVPTVFAFIQGLGRIPPPEMARVFNMGIGMVAIVAHRHAQGVLRSLRALGERPCLIGKIVKGPQEVRFVPSSI